MIRKESKKLEKMRFKREVRSIRKNMERRDEIYTHSHGIKQGPSNGK